MTKICSDRPNGVVLLSAGILTAFMAYFLGVDGAFFFDDAPNITRNPSVALDDLSWASLRFAWEGGTSGQVGRPLSQLTFALNHYFSGFSPKAFKLTNVVLHCLNGVLVYVLVRQLLDSLRGVLKSIRVDVIAALVAWLWLLHPIQLTSVLYAVQRMTSLSAFFVLAALIVHIFARRSRGGVAAKSLLLMLAWLVFWPLAILSKETALLFPGFVCIYELIVRRSEYGRLDALGRAWLALLVVVAVCIGPYLASPFGQWLLSGYQIRSFSLAERLLTEARVIWLYVSWIAFPSLGNLALFHDDITLSTSLIDPWTTLSAVVGLVALVFIAAYNVRRSPLISFGIAWFLIGHSLESTFVPLEIAHEHRNYLPLLGLLLVPTGWLSGLAKVPGASRTFALSVSLGFLAYSGFVTAMRADMYSHEFRRTQIESQAHPQSARANYEAGRSLAALADNGHNIMASVLSKKHFEMATNADPDYKMGLLGQIILACGVTQVADVAAIEELERRFRNRLVLQDDTSILMTIVEMSGAGLLCLDRGQIDGLFSSFFANPRVAGGMKLAMYSLHADYLWLSQRDLDKAREALRNALQISPQNPSIRLKWAQLDFIAGDHAAAKTLLLQLRGEPLVPSERDTLANILRALESADR